MLLTFQDRLRIPWRDGAKQVSLDALVPMFVLPLVIGIAAVNIYTTVIMLLATAIFVCYAYHFIKRALPRSKFLFMWIFWSAVYMMTLYELEVPLMELLPVENLILIIFFVISVYCLWKTRRLAVVNHVVQSTVDKDELPDITEAAEEEEEQTQETVLLLDHTKDESDDERHHPAICETCHKYVQPRTFHCSVCQACIRRHDHHSYWLNCCIGASNHRYYMLGLIFVELLLVVGAYLILTAVCHPMLVIRIGDMPFFLPDDCSDVYDEYVLGLSFVVAVYALVMAVCVLWVLFRQCTLISKGTTMSECLRGQTSNGKTLWHNGKAFFA